MVTLFTISLKAAVWILELTKPGTTHFNRAFSVYSVYPKTVIKTCGDMIFKCWISFRTNLSRRTHFRFNSCRCVQQLGTQRSSGFSTFFLLKLQFWGNYTSLLNKSKTYRLYPSCIPILLTITSEILPKNTLLSVHALTNAAAHSRKADIARDLCLSLSLKFPPNHFT
jgi:hypothetical protein